MIIPEFTLGSDITPAQREFFARTGFIRFRGVASPAEVAALRAATDALEARFR